MTDAEKLYVESLDKATEEQELHLSQCYEEVAHYGNMIRHNTAMLKYAQKQRDIVDERIKQDKEFKALYIASLEE